jgi:hypothetical protein
MILDKFNISLTYNNKEYTGEVTYLSDSSFHGRPFNQYWVYINRFKARVLAFCEFETGKLINVFDESVEKDLAEIVLESLVKKLALQKTVVA